MLYLFSAFSYGVDTSQVSIIIIVVCFSTLWGKMKKSYCREAALLEKERAMFVCCFVI